MWYIILFIFSLVGIVVVLSLKALEEKKGLKILPDGISSRFDKKAVESADYLKKQVAEFDLKKVYNITKKIADVVGKIYSKLFEKILEKVSNGDMKIIKFVKGKKVLSRNGEASKFLQDVAEHKRNLRKGDIKK